MNRQRGTASSKVFTALWMVSEGPLSALWLFDRSERRLKLSVCMRGTFVFCSMQNVRKSTFARALKRNEKFIRYPRDSGILANLNNREYIFHRRWTKVLEIILRNITIRDILLRSLQGSWIFHN